MAIGDLGGAIGDLGGAIGVILERGTGTVFPRCGKAANSATRKVTMWPSVGKRQNGKRKRRKERREIENLKEKMEIRMGDLKMAKLKFVKFPRSFRGVDKDPHRPAQKLATRKSELKNPKLKIAK